LELTLVNDQLEFLQSDLIVSKCIKNVAAGNEIIKSFGLASWAVYFIHKWETSEKQMKMFENIYL